MRRTAFTIIELLVVLAIIGTLISLLVPAVQRARESANYIKCRSQLRQIGIAIHNFEAQHGYLPGVGNLPHQHSVLTAILPYVEQDNLRQIIQHDRPLFAPIGDTGILDPVQAEAARTQVRFFLCPSENMMPLFTGIDQATLAGTNYVANAGTGTGTYFDFRYPTDGVFWFGSRTRFRDITDGISSTLFFSEALLGAGYDSYSAETADMRRQWMNAACSTAPNPSSPGTTPPLTDAICSQTLGMTYRGDRNVSWIGGPGHRTLFNTYSMPNDHMGDCGLYGIGRFKAASQHPGGVNMILGDCSVHFIKNHIELATWRALGTRGDCEALGSYCGCH